jgi:mannose-6-phosphate isomerase-like protein (cupin superfamily)
MSPLKMHWNRGEGNSYQLGGITFTFKRVDSDSAYSVFETVSEKPSTGAGLHRHWNYEETHVVIEGEYEFYLGDQSFTLGPGGMVYIPRGVVHGMLKLNAGIGRQLVISAPAGIFEAFVAEVAAAQVDTGSAKRDGATDFKKIAAQHGIEFVP